MRTAWRRVLWLSGAVVLVGGGLLWAARAHSAAASATPQYFTVPASVGPVTVTVSGTGTIQPAAALTVTPLEGGVVRSVAVAVGQRVRAGQVLFTLQDTQDLAQQVTADQASLASAENQLQNLVDPEAQVSPLSIQAAQEKVQQAQLTLQQAQLTLQQAQANAAAQSQLLSPVSGSVLSTAVSPGQQVNPGALIATILPSSPPQVTVPVPEDELPYLAVGSPAAVTVPPPPAPGQTWQGAVTAIAVQAATAPGTGGSTSTGGGSTGTGGTPAAEQGSSPLFDVTVTLRAAPSLPEGAAATVVLTPRLRLHPPAGDNWLFTGTISYPAAIPLVAQQSGTVMRLLPQGSSVRPGALVATISNTDVAATLRTDQLTVQQDVLALKQAEIALEQTEHPQPGTPQAIAAAHLQVEALKAALQNAERNLAELTVRAPSAGTVAAVNVQPGQAVGPSTPAVTLDVGPLQAVASIDELDIGKVRVGRPAQVQVAALPGELFPGRVIQIAPSATVESGISTYPVTVALQRTTGLLAGMSATVLVQVASARRAVRVPAQAVTTFGGGTRGIVRVLENGKAVPVRVRVGLVGSQFTQITSGVQPGEAVIAGSAAAANSTRPFAFFRGAFGGGPRGGRAAGR